MNRTAWSSALDQSISTPEMNTESCFEIEQENEDKYMTNISLSSSIHEPREIQPGLEDAIQMPTARACSAVNAIPTGRDNVVCYLSSDREDHLLELPPRKKARFNNVVSDQSGIEELDETWGAPWVGKEVGSALSREPAQSNLRSACEASSTAEEEIRDHTITEHSSQDACLQRDPDTDDGSAKLTAQAQTVEPVSAAQYAEHSQKRCAVQEISPSPGDGAVRIDIKLPNINAIHDTYKAVSARHVKPVCRIETFQTEMGKKRRRVVGPFVLEDDEDGEIDASMLSPNDETYGRLKGYSMRNGDLTFGNHNNIRSHSDLPELEPVSTSNGKRAEEMKLVRRRKKSQNKCADLSRMMREETIARREAYRHDEFQIGSNAFRGDTSESFEIHTASSSFSSNPNTSAVTEVFGEAPVVDLVNKATTTAERTLLGRENDRCGGKIFPSAEDIEAQLNAAQTLFHANHNAEGDVFSQKDFASSPFRSVSASGGQRAGTVFPGEHLQHIVRDLPECDPIPLQGTQTVSDGARKTVISGKKGVDQKLAESSGQNSTKAETLNNVARLWEEHCENDDHRQIGTTKSESAMPQNIDGAKGRNESKLLAAKEPLKTSANVSGGLPRLAQMTDVRKESIENRRNFDDDPHNLAYVRRGNTQARYQVDGRRPIDQANWTREGSLRKRKADVENMMRALMEAARCWWIVYNSLSYQRQGHMESELVELLQDFARPIYQGYFSKNRALKRLKSITSNMLARISRYQMRQPFERSPTQQEIENTLIDLIGRNMLQRVKNLHREVLAEYELHSKVREGGSHHRGDTSMSGRSFGRNEGRRRHSAKASNLSEQLEFDLGLSQATRLKGKARADQEREDAEAAQIRRQLARFDTASGPALNNKSTKRVHFSDEVLWSEEHDQKESSVSEESEVDEAQITASSEGGTYDIARPMAGRESGETGVSRSNQGGKGILSEIRGQNKGQTMTGVIVREGSTLEDEKLQSGIESPASGNCPGRNSVGRKSLGRKSVGRKSLGRTDKEHAGEQLTRKPGFPDDSDGDGVEEAEIDSLNLDDDAEGSLSEDIYGERHFTQYEIVADYDNFDKHEDGKGVPLGRHIDVRAALRQMRKVTSDAAAWASKKHRRLRLIWDTDDFELESQTLILPTGGECRVRMVKSWAPATNWPGRLGANEEVTPKVFYIVHETETISLRPLEDSTRAGIDRGGDDNDPVEPTDFSDPQARQLQERDMCFSSRRVANEVARNRWLARLARQRPEKALPEKKPKEKKEMKKQRKKEKMKTKTKLTKSTTMTVTTPTTI